MRSKMTDLEENKTNDKSREFQANERTFLAWVRTSIALMGFGFVIVKFNLFLKQISFVLQAEDFSEKPHGTTVGTIMVAIGLIIAIFAYIQFNRNARQLATNTYAPATKLPLLLTLIIAVGGAFLVAYFLTIR